MMDYKGELRLVLHLSGKGRYLTSKLSNTWMNFGVDPLNWQSFIEIGEIACSTTALCSRKHNLKNKNCHPKKSF